MKNTLHINDFSWGEVNVNNMIFKDVILCSDGKFIQEWNWKIFNTSHKQINIKEFDYLDSYPYVTDLIITKGVDNKLKFDENGLKFLSNKYSQLSIWHLQTTDAIDKYRELVNNGKIVFAYIHSTC